ncbi:hypothetical protein Tco_0654321 [Tanacetum coccineum]|uniref:Uncharacterized protein n=1 Tax=Tanacetum coccineum TaxID=301880 RepID=A0ABQ4X2W1_9ASTR
MSLSAEVRMRAEYNVKERRRLKSVVEKQDELLKVRVGEIDNLKAQLLPREAEATEAIHLHAESSNFETVEKSLQDEVNTLKERNTILEKERTALDVKVTDLEALVVHELELSSFGLQEKVTVYKDYMGKLVKFQDDQMKEVNDKFDKLAALGNAIEKGMQDGLSAGITHGVEGRALTDVSTYNPSTEADYISTLQHLQNVNFSLLAELRYNKDASVDTLMNILCLEKTLAERLGLTESQPYADQLMVPIHHSLDKVVIGATALSLALDVSNIRVQRIRENIANQRSALRDVFVSLSKPFSTEVLTGVEGTFDIMSTTGPITTALSTTFACTGSIAPISVDDYEVAGTDDQVGTDEHATPFPNVDDAELNIS